MKVLFLAPRFLPQIGGVERHIFFVARELVARGHEVFVLTQTDVPAPESEDLQGVRVVRIRRRWTPERSTLFRVVSVLAAWPAIFRAVRRIPRPDLVHGHDFAFLFWMVPIALRFGRRPWFVTFHGYEAERIPRWAVFGRRLSAVLARGTISVGAFIPLWYGTKADVITYGAVSDERKPPASADRSDALLFVGRVSSDGLLENYLDALGALGPLEAPAVVDAYGEGELAKSVLARIEARGISVHLMGATNEPEAVYPKYHVVLAGGYLGILEAIQAGCFVVALAPTPLLKDFYTLHPCCGHGMDVADSLPKFKTLIQSVEHDATRRIRLVEEGQQIIGGMTWRKLVDAYERLWGRM